MSERTVLRNMKLVDGSECDIVIEDGIISSITAPGEGCGENIHFLSEHYVSSGWIDFHVHADSELHPYGDELDEIGVKQGVATVVDAGSCGADRIGELLTMEGRTNLFAFLNVSRIGLQRVDELSNLVWLERESLLQAVQKYRKQIVGLKVRMSGSVIGKNGIAPLQIARKFSEETSLPLMVHIGSAPPDINEILPVLKAGDVLTHYLHGKQNNLFDERGTPLPEFISALQRGIYLDVGHGTASFSYKVAETAKRHDIPLHIISTDIYRGNRLNGPVYSLAHVLSKFLNLGYSLEQVVEAATIQPAQWLKKPELGRIQVGDQANLTIFTVERKPVNFIDSQRIQRTGDQQIIAKGVVVNGEFIEC